MKAEAELDKGIQWYKEAKMGMFYHFGLYSLLGDNENQIRKKVSKSDYRKLMDKFDVKNFNADQWVACAASMGARYIVPTSRHAEGFCLWDSKLTKYKSTNTPCGRDLIAELSQACAKTDVHFAFYFNLETWLNEGDDLWNEMGLSYAEYIEGQLTELLTNYGPVGLIWFDHGNYKEIPFKRLKKIHALIKQLQPQCLVNGRGKRKVDPAIGDFLTPERDFPECDYSKNLVIESCDAMGVSSWGYDKDGCFWSVPELAKRVSICASQGHNYLLNVEPQPDGKIRNECVVRARGLGNWVKKHQDALVAERSEIQPKDPNLLYQPTLGVSTVAGKTLHVHLHQWPVSDAILLPVSGKVKSDKFTAEKTDEGIIIKGLPSVPPEKNSPWIVPVEFVKPPVALAQKGKQTMKPDPAGTIFLSPVECEIKTVNGIIIPKPNRYPDGRASMGSLHFIGDRLSWKIKVPKSGKYEVYAAFGSIKNQEDAEFELSVGKSKLKGKTWISEHWSKPITKKVGKIKIDKNSRKIKLKVTAVTNGSFSDIHGIWLVPV